MADVPVHDVNTLFLLGWYLTRPAKKPANHLPRPELLPDYIISGGGCFCELHPHLVEDIYVLEKNAMDAVLAKSVNTWSHVCYQPTPADADALNAAYFDNAFSIYGLAFPPQHQEALGRALTESAAIYGNPLAPGFTIERQRLSGGEIHLGYDVMCLNCGWITFHCNHLQEVLFDRFGERLNSHGLINSLSVAEALSAWINEDPGRRGEPGFWLPYAILRPAEDQYREDKPLCNNLISRV